MAEAVLIPFGDSKEMRASLGRALGRDWPWTPQLVQRLLNRFSEQPEWRELLDFFARDKELAAAWTDHLEELCSATWQRGPQLERAALVASDWELPRLEAEADLANWLGVSQAELSWFADHRGINSSTPSERLQHYRAWLVPKGNERYRLIEAPKPRLRNMQRKVLDEILAKIPAHPAAHGFVRGRSVLSFARPHVRPAILLRFDLRNFFPQHPARQSGKRIFKHGFPARGRKKPGRSLHHKMSARYGRASR